MYKLSYVSSIIVYMYGKVSITQLKLVTRLVDIAAN